MSDSGPRSEAQAEVGRTGEAAAAARRRLPAEVVLPLPYYLILVAEVIGLVVLHYRWKEESGGDPHSHWLGWIGTASMLLMHVYSVRRRVRALRDFGPLRNWLHFHIFMGLQGALLVTFHSSHLRTLGNISGATIALTLVVVCSGMFGRYLYAMIPKGVTGERLTAKQVEEELATLTTELRESAPTPELATAIASYAEGPKLHGRVPLGTLIREDARSRRALRQLEHSMRETLKSAVTLKSLDHAVKADQFLALARRRVLLARRLLTLGSADAFFRNWTLLHKPLTFLLGGLTFLHVLSHYLYRAAYGA